MYFHMNHMKLVVFNSLPLKLSISYDITYILAINIFLINTHTHKYISLTCFPDGIVNQKHLQMSGLLDLEYTCANPDHEKLTVVLSQYINIAQYTLWR